MALPETWILRQKIIGVLLRQARLEAGKSLKECGQAMRVSSAILSAIERGKRGISLPELELLAFYLDIPLDYLLDNQTAPFGPTLEDLPGEELLLIRQRIIGTLLRQARLDLGLSQGELAKTVGLPKRRLSLYELGEKPIPLVELEELANALDISLAHFLDEGIGRIGEQQQRENEWREFRQMPPDVRAFVLRPINLSYLQLAMSLSAVPGDGLRDIAASLLDITL